MTKKGAYRSNSSLTFNVKIFSLLSTSRRLFHSSLTYNTTAPSDKKICTEYVDSRKRENGFGQVFWSENDTNYLGFELELFKTDNNRDFRLVQNLKLGEAKSTQPIRLRNQLPIAGEIFGTGENLSQVLIRNG